jgi:hypothetical protein
MASHPAPHEESEPVGDSGGGALPSVSYVADPFDLLRPPHDPADLPPGASPTSALGAARGGKRPRKKAVFWEVIRPLRMPDDLPLLSQSLPAPRQTISQLRHSHHQLAQMLATGTKQAECSLITGYSPAYISNLKNDPTFQELIAHYSTQREMVFVDVIERMRSLGLSTLDEIQSRMEEDPTQFTNRELHEQAELLLVKPMAATRGLIRPGDTAAAQGAGGVQVNVNFIKSETPMPAAEITIDMEPNKP